MWDKSEGRRVRRCSPDSLLSHFAGSRRAHPDVPARADDVSRPRPDGFARVDDVSRAHPDGFARVDDVSRPRPDGFARVDDVSRPHPVLQRALDVGSRPRRHRSRGSYGSSAFTLNFTCHPSLRA